MISQRRGFDPAVIVRGSKCGTSQSDGYIRAGVRNEYNDSEHGSENAVGLLGIACISLP